MNENARTLSPSVPRNDDVPRIRDISAQELDERYVRRNQPVILTGATAGWPALASWSLDYFAERFGDVLVLAGRTDKGKLLLSDKTGIPQVELPFREYIDQLRSGRTDLYLLSPVEERLPALLEDLAPPEIQRHAAWRSTRLWLGPEGAVSPLHRDFPENLYVQVLGRKRVILIDRRHTRLVYPRRPWSGVPNFSRVDAERPDDPRFPRFAAAPRLVCVVEPGEILYIPRMWWHHVRSLETSASINLWFANGTVAFAARLLQLYARARQLRK